MRYIINIIFINNSIKALTWKLENFIDKKCLILNINLNDVIQINKKKYQGLFYYSIQGILRIR